MEFDVQQLKKTTLAPVDDAHAFHCCDGSSAHSIRELAERFSHLSIEQFQHHVSPQGPHNHPAMWIKDVLHNPVLAHDLNYPINLNNQQHFLKTIRDHVHWLESI